MISRKMKLVSAAIAAAVLIATPALVRAVHKDGTLVAQTHERAHGQARNANAVVGPDGKLIGAAADLNVRSYMQQDGLPN
jgi:hypothetical protein